MSPALNKHSDCVFMDHVGTVWGVSTEGNGCPVCLTSTGRKDYRVQKGRVRWHGAGDSLAKGDLRPAS